MPTESQPTQSLCPCRVLESPLVYDDCCGPLHRRERDAATPEELMRSRYSAYVLGLGDHVFRTWHPRTRPDDLDGGAVGFTGLEIVSAPEPEGDRGEVEFVAHHPYGDLREHSVFERRRGRWEYVEAL